MRCWPFTTSREFAQALLNSAKRALPVNDVKRAVADQRQKHIITPWQGSGTLGHGPPANDTAERQKMFRSMLNIEKRSPPRLMLSGVGLASKDGVFLSSCASRAA
jgi:hypothetical protein